MKTIKSMKPDTGAIRSEVKHQKQLDRPVNNQGNAILQLDLTEIKCSSGCIFQRSEIIDRSREEKEDYVCFQNFQDRVDGNVATIYSHGLTHWRFFATQKGLVRSWSWYVMDHHRRRRTTEYVSC